MNLLTCNMLRQGFPSNLPVLNVPQKMQFHRTAAAPSLRNFINTTTKRFENPNFFNQKTVEKIPSSYKHSHNTTTLNTSNMIPEKLNLPDSDNLLIEAMESLCTEKIVQKVEACASKEIEPREVTTVTDSVVETSDSDDSFIVFEAEEGLSNGKAMESEEEFVDDSSSEDDDEDRCESLVLISKPGKRERLASVAESEDSFIVFEDNNSEEEEDTEVEEDDEEDVEESSEEEEAERTCKSNGKKVSFADGPKLCTVHLMIKWNFAYRKARKGLWEQFARDNERFRFRICNFGDTLNKFLQPEHRRKIYEERFKE